MALNEKPEMVVRPSMHYVYLEAVGPFMETAPACWQKLHNLLGGVAEKNTITGYMSLYKAGPQIYRAGVSVAAEPSALPAELAYESVQGGRYASFRLTGAYDQLGPATGRAFQLVDELKLPVRDDFNIENYLNDPRVTPVTELITEILFPVL